MFEPSTQIRALLDAAAITASAAAAVQAVAAREDAFSGPTQARLAGIALDPSARADADQLLDEQWSDRQRRDDTLASAGPTPEVIIGSGLHAATYAAIRVLSGHPRPLVLERGERAGGTFAMTDRAVFRLNSRNRPGRPGPAGDLTTDLNHLPGAPLQAAQISMADYVTNTDLAFVIRLTLAQYADVATNTTVVAAGPEGYDDSTARLELADGASLIAGRVIDARGLGDPRDAVLANDTTILTFPQFMRRMAGTWPLRGIRRVAVIGGGDSGKCAVESLLGIAPPPLVAAAALDHVDRIDWYAPDLPTDCPDWQDRIRGRYQPIGRYLRPDRYGARRLNILTRRARPLALPGTALIDGQTYDLVIMCTGNQQDDIDGLDLGSFDEHQTPDGNTVARRHLDLPAYRVGPGAYLPFTTRERQNGIADIPANAVAIFRTAPKTAALAATLPPPD